MGRGGACPANSLGQSLSKGRQAGRCEGGGQGRLEGQAASPCQAASAGRQGGPPLCGLYQGSEPPGSSRCPQEDKLLRTRVEPPPPPRWKGGGMGQFSDDGVGERRQCGFKPR